MTTLGPGFWAAARSAIRESRVGIAYDYWDRFLVEVLGEQVIGRYSSESSALLELRAWRLQRIRDLGGYRP